jgi:hypothetical protein
MDIEKKSSGQKSDENSLLVAAYKKWPAWERGILNFDLALCSRAMGRIGHSERFALFLVS